MINNKISSNKINNNNNEFLKEAAVAVNIIPATNMLNQHNKENDLLLNDFFEGEKKIFNIDNNFINNENKNKLINNLSNKGNTDLNLRESLIKSEAYFNLTTTNEISQLSSFIEANFNSKNSEIFNFPSKPFSWTNVTFASGKKPSARKDYSVILADTYLVFFGGCTDDNEFYSDLYFYDILGQTWLEIKQQGKVPSARCGHISKLYGSVMWMFGGYSREGHLNDLYSLNLETV